MTEPEEPQQPGAALPPLGDDGLRALLASARVQEPMPRDVADRLDRTLAELRGLSSGSPRPGLPARHRVASALVAAAAAVVVVLGGVTVLRSSPGSPDSGAARTGAAAPSRDQSAKQSSGATPGLVPRAPQPPGTSRHGSQSTGGGSALRTAGPPALTTSDLTAQAAALVPQIGADQTQQVVRDGCLGNRMLGLGDRAARVLLDGRPAALLAPGGDAGRAVVLSCPAQPSPADPAGRLLAQVGR